MWVRCGPRYSSAHRGTRTLRETDPDRQKSKHIELHSFKQIKHAVISSCASSIALSLVSKSLHLQDVTKMEQPMKTELPNRMILVPEVTCQQKDAGYEDAPTGSSHHASQLLILTLVHLFLFQMRSQIMLSGLSPI